MYDASKDSQYRVEWLEKGDGDPNEVGSEEEEGFGLGAPGSGESESAGTDPFWALDDDAAAAGAAVPGSGTALDLSKDEEDPFWS